jgi:endonuclease/exonuclease/phosphatase family metal-dependent hydrolase
MPGSNVLVLEEAWTNDSDGEGSGQAEQIAAALGYQAFTRTLAHGRRAHPQPDATDHWMPRLGYRASLKALFLNSIRPLPPAAAGSVRYQSGDPGSWGIAVLVRDGLEVEGTRTLELPALPRDRVHRAAIVVDMTVEGRAISVVGTHMSHLQYGSHRHYALMKDLLAREARPDALLLGDMNLWGPPVRAFLPAWHRAVRGRTWPSWNPHSQIDHILYRGALGATGGEVMPDAGSDHRPVRATITLA